jgi:alanine racemase
VIRSTVARVDLDALTSNFAAIQRFLAHEPGRTPPGIIAVVKANAYGHGAANVALALEQAGATMLACADIEEGIVLRRAGVRVPILIFGALSVSDLEGLFEFSLTPTISTPSAARAVQIAAAHHQTTLGISPEDRHRHESPRVSTRQSAPHVAGAAVERESEARMRSTRISRRRMCRRARCSRRSARITRRRLGLSTSCCRGLKVRAASADTLPRFLRHAANSAAILRDSRVWLDVVRPGLLLYGIVPPPLASTIPLKPVMSLTSRVVAVKGLRPGEGVGYGWKFQADAPRTIAVVPAGYADGLDARLSGRGVVLIRGRRVPIVGAVSMDMITVDVTDAGDVQPGDEVVLLGRQGDESWQQIDAREVAAAIGTIPWEVVCRLGTRIERHYSESLRFLDHCAKLSIDA